MNLNLNRIEFSSSSAQLRCPCCDEYYNFFCYPGITVFFCRDAMPSLLEGLPDDFSNSVRGYNAVYITCEIGLLADAMYASN